LDEQVAIEVGFEKPVVHGMLSMAFLARMLTSHFGVGAIAHLHTRFTGVALRGQTLQFQAKLEQVVDQVAHYQLSVSNENGAGVIEGSAQIKQLT
jgi:acyl dehydratase